MANERVLIIDDERGVVRSCTRILQYEGFVVSGITDSTQVPMLLKQETFDLLLTDIKMPKIDGLELLKIAKEIDPHITVVLITGYGTMEDAIEAIRLGAQGFLMKPFEPEELVATVRDNLSRRALIRDSLRLQTLLPLLEINQILQVSGGEISLARRILEVANRGIGAARIAWLSCNQPFPPDSLNPKKLFHQLTPMAIVPAHQTETGLPEAAIRQLLETAKPVWILADGSRVDHHAGQPNVMGALMPLSVRGEIVGVLTAETDRGKNGRLFGRIGLELFSVLAGQLAIIIENVQLFQQAERLRTFNEDIIHNMTNGLIAINREKIVTAFNPAAATMLGSHSDRVLHRPLSEIIGKNIELTTIFDKTLATGQAQPYQEITISDRAGDQLPISIRVAPLQGNNSRSEPAGAVSVIEDLSEIKALAAARRRLDRLAALGEMAAVVAHEIRNPVAGIAAGVEYLTRNAARDSVEFEGALLIKGEVERVNRILEDILFVARPLQLNRVDGALVPIIDRVIERCRAQAAAGQIEIVTAYDQNLPLLKLDSQRLEQVFSNLIINATQAMSGGGRLSIRIQAKPAVGVTITITDTGPGIPADRLSQIFEPFFTTRSKGTGLGLSIARQIVEGHDGTIQVESQEDKGTSFVINLPAVVEQPEA